MSSSEEKNVPWKWIGLAAVVLAIFGLWFLLPVNEWLQSFNRWIKGLGAVGLMIFAAVYILATVMLAPGSPFTIAVELAFGGWGFPLVLVSATIAAGLAFGGTLSRAQSSQ